MKTIQEVREEISQVMVARNLAFTRGYKALADSAENHLLRLNRVLDKLKARAIKHGQSINQLFY